MSFVVKTQREIINNKEQRDLLFLKERRDYDFKFVPERHFKHIVKNVQRQRSKEDEERVWLSFVKQQEYTLKLDKQNIQTSMQSAKDLLRESIQNVDSELKRLEEDALPERTKRICDESQTDGQAKRVSVKCNTPNKNSLTKDNDDCDTNILIPISKEGNVYSHDRDHQPKLAGRSTVVKSSSDPSIVEKKKSISRLAHGSSDCSKMNWSSKPTDKSAYEKEEVAYTRLDPTTIHKILSMQTKIAELLDEISFRLYRIPLPDGDDDLKRRQQRAMEFAIRFSRNYLYNLNRFVASIQRHIGAVSLRAGVKQNPRSVAFHYETIEQKLVSAHQLLVHALTAYCKHIPSSVFRGHPIKLKELLQVIVSLKDICDKVQVFATYCGSGDGDILPLGKELQDKCDIILTALDVGSEAERLPINCNAKPIQVPTSASLNRKRSGKKNLPTRLSMYGTDIKPFKNDQRKRTDQRKRCIKGGVRLQNLTLDQQCYATSSRDVIQSDSSKYANISREDEIKTVMDRIPMDSENDSNFEVGKKRSNKTSVAQKSQGSQTNSSTGLTKGTNFEKKENCGKTGNVVNDEDLLKKVQMITKEHLSTLVPVIADLMTLVSKKLNDVEIQPVSETSVESLLEFIQKYQSPKNSNAKTASNCCSCSSFEAGYECSRFKSKGLSETRGNAANVQLICLSEKRPETPERKVNSEISIEVTEAKKLKLIVSIKSEQDFLQYQSDYKKFCASKPMYSTNTQNKPWDVVAWIADKLVEELICEITEELQMTDLIKKLFDMEFQEV